MTSNAIRLAHTAQRWSATAGPCTGCGTSTHCLVASTGLAMCLPCQEKSVATQVAEHSMRRAAR